MAGRRVAVVFAVVAVGAIGAGGGAVAGVMTRAEPVIQGVATPVAAPTTVSTPPPPLMVSADPPIPVALEKPRRWRSIHAPILTKGQETLRVDVPYEWTESLRIRVNPPEGRFRLYRDYRDYDLRVQAKPEMTSPARTRDERADQLQHNGTTGLRVISKDSGSVESRIDGTTRRYEELFYSYVDVNQHRRFVRLRWTDGLELAVTGRARDIEALAVVLDRATRTAELVPGTKTDKPS